MESIVISKAHIRQVMLDNMDTPYEWGTWDCCIFVLSCIDPDSVSIARGHYSDRDGAMERLAEFGGFDGYLVGRGAERIAAGDCRTGDVVCFEDGDGLGIVDRAEVVTIHEQMGMVRLPRKVIESGWRF